MHEGHRDRMRERILLSGIESLQPHEVLEYLLYHAIPRKDTNGIAHELISKFGSFNGVLNADYDALLDVNGMTANAALLLTSLKGVFRMYASGDKKGQNRHCDARRPCQVSQPVFLRRKDRKVLHAVS